MRWLLSLLLLGLLAVVQAVSSSGDKLLVVLEELSEKSKYSKYFGDLEGKSSLYDAPLGDFTDVRDRRTRFQNYIRITEE